MSLEPAPREGGRYLNSVPESEQKEVLWIEGTTRRFGGYTYFGEHSAKMLGWSNPRVKQ
jgi:hypothetical protein